MSERGGERLFRCRTCWDEGWIDADDGGRTVRPCPLCKSAQHAHWRDGGYRPSSEGGVPLASKRAGAEAPA